MSNRFTGRCGNGRGRRHTRCFESLEDRQLLSALPVVADTATSNGTYIESVYQDVLGRQADPGGLDWAAGIVNSGQSDANFVATVVTSQEANVQFIDSVYQQYLGRAADSTGINFWLGQMQAGVTNEAVQAAFLAGDEFYARAGGTTEGWVQAAFQTVLGRAAETDAVSWATSQLQAGASLHDLATALITSQESETRIIDRNLARFAMPVVPISVAAYSEQLSTGQITDQQVATDLLSSPQYFEIHTGVPETIVPVPNVLPGVTKVEANIAAQAAKGNANVVFIGDSITQIWQTTGLSAWNQYFVPLGSLDAGVAGDTTENVLWRLEQGNLNGISPKLAVVMVGINDISKGNVSDIATGITSVVRTVQNDFPQAKVLLLSVLPGLAIAADSPLRQEIDQINQTIAPLADEQRIWFLDLSPQFVNPDGSLNQSLFQADHTHPNAQGFQVLAQAIAPWVQALS